MIYFELNKLDIIYENIPLNKHTLKLMRKSKY